MWTLLPSLVLFAPAGFVASGPQDPTPVLSDITEVTVYRDRALVRRTAELPGSGGPCVLEGLTYSLDRDNVRVRCTSGDVVSVEIRDRFEKTVPDERVEALRNQKRGLDDEHAALRDAGHVLDMMEQHLMRLLSQEAGSHQREVAEGRPSPEAWQASYDFLFQRLMENRRLKRENKGQSEELERAIRDLNFELGQIEAGGGVHVYDVHVDVVADGTGVPLLDVEYIVGNAGWRPVYDLRTARDASSVRLVYRANVWQQSGEDWDEVQLGLSTAEPRRGAQGPEARTVWVDVASAKPARGFQDSRYTTGEDAPSAGSLVEFEMVEASEDARRPFASVQDEGLSVRFLIAEIETIESRQQPTVVLVGKADLDVDPEYYAVPSIDPTVWLRGRAENTSDWILLPGQASVFFGADFLGQAQLGTVQPDEKFDLHLGQAQGLTIERTMTEDKTKSGGFLSNRSRLVESWRVHVENHGAVAAKADGSVEVIVREMLPKAKSDKISVSLESATPKPSKDERWTEDRDDKGILTWILSVPKGGATDLRFETQIAYPKGQILVKN